MTEWQRLLGEYRLAVLAHHVAVAPSKAAAAKRLGIRYQSLCQIQRSWRARLRRHALTRAGLAR